MSAQNKNIGETIRKARLARGYTQLRLSELTNVSLRSIQRIESGEVKPRQDTLNLLAAELQISLDQFIVDGGDVTMPIGPRQRKPNRIILQIGTAVLAVLLGCAYLSQSTKFPETNFELSMFWAGATVIYLAITLWIWRK